MNHASEYIVFAYWFGENSFRINDHCVTYYAFHFRYTETNLSVYYYDYDDDYYYYLPYARYFYLYS